MRGYLPVDPRAGVVDEDFSMQQSAIADLTQRKQELLYELTSYQNTRSSMVQVGLCTKGAAALSIGAAQLTQLLD